MKDILKVKVMLWGEEIGALTWDDVRQVSTFQFTERYHQLPYNIQPTKPAKPMIPFYGVHGEKYHGLPPFIADSLPDNWGSIIFEKWAAEHGIPSRECNPLLKLSYIGKRGIGALEFMPEVEPSSAQFDSLSSLEALSQRTYRSRSELVIDDGQRRDFEALSRLGSPPGGAHSKILVAVSDDDSSIISGQVDPREGFTQYILKFKEDYDVPSCEIEYVYYLMAKNAGIAMMPSRLFEINGQKHFLTQRFDRQGSGKLLSQTMAALVPGATDYQNLFFLCETLDLTGDERVELYRRMCFNVVAGVTDDHNKNFSFLMFPDGHWELAPAYDLTFTGNTLLSPANGVHSLGIYTRRSGFTAEDLIRFGDDFDIPNPETVLHEVCRAVSEFPALAKSQGIPQKWSEFISGSLDRLFPERAALAAR